MQQRIEGQECPDCKGKYVKSPKTGKVFCENKCWTLKNDQSGAAPETKSPEPTKEEWKEIGQAKARTKIAEACIRADKSTGDADNWMEWINNKPPF